MSATPGDTSASLIEEAFNSAVTHYRNGQFEMAEQLFRAILELDPNHANANYNLGLLAAHFKRMPEALQFLNAALAAAPQEEVFWLSYLEALVSSGDIPTAQQALALSREHGLMLRGTVVDHLVALATAQAAPPVAVPVAPPPATPVSQTPAEQPKDAEIRATTTAFQRKDYAMLEMLGLDITQRYPGAIAGWKALSLAYFNTKRPELALAPTKKIVDLQPDDAQAHANLGLIYMSLRQLPEADASLTHAIALNPSAADTYTNLGNVRRDQNRNEEAEICYRRAIALDPKQGVAHANLGIVLLERGIFREAEASLRTALALEPNNATTLGGLATVLAKLGLLGEAEACARRSIEIDPDNIFAYDMLLFLFNYTHTDKAKEARELAQRYGDIMPRKVGPRYTEWRCEPAPQRLKVGLVSGDLNSHPVGYFTETLLRHLDPARVEIVVYSNMPERKHDATTAALRPLVSNWYSIQFAKNTDAAAQIHADGIHVLIDLSGHTTDNRLPIFAMKPAPVQATWLGYFATTGIAEIDYFIGDPWLCPPEEEGDFTETIWRLPATWLCFTPPTPDIPVAPLPAQTNGYVTFGCFNNLNKMNDAVVALWSEVLKQVPSSKLLLKAPQFVDDHARTEAQRRFAAHGIASERLLLEGPETRSDYLTAYGKVDICLDPFPYPGGTTSVESLWMGVPVLTLHGNRFLSHLGESIAHNAGLSDWIAADTSDYVTKAVHFSNDLPALAALRSRMRERMRASPLLDAPRFARDFTDMLWAMWGGSTPPAAQKKTPEKSRLKKLAPHKEPTHSEVTKLRQLLDQKRYAETERTGQSMVLKYPNAVAGWKALSVAQYHLGHLEQARHATEKLIELLPKEAAGYSRLGALLILQGHTDAAERHLRQALAIDPKHLDAYNNLGYVLSHQGRIEEAATLYQRAIEINPSAANAHASLGVIRLEQFDFRNAENSLRKALSLDPDNETALVALNTVLNELGLLDEAIQIAKRTIGKYPDNTAIYSKLLFVLNYLTTSHSKEAHEYALRYGKLVSRKAGKPYTQWHCNPAPTKLRIGFVSADLRNHPVGYFLEGLLRNLDPTRVELVAYSNRPVWKTTELTDTLRPYFAEWKQIDHLDDVDAAAQIHADGIHILIDLAGHTGANRLPTFAYKPAPVQATWLGYFATTGVTEIDWLIGDPNVCPTTEEHHFTEKIWRLPETYLCFTPPNYNVEVGSLPALANGYVTFGCFNNIGKYTDAVIALWSDILKRIPNARLLLKAKQFNDDAMLAQMRTRFAAHGITDTQLLLEGPASRVDYFNAYNRIDINLDPFPYPGGTTSVEALWMGVPVLTLRGNRMLSHAGENIMTNLGLPEWIAVDEVDYANKAVAFAADLATLSVLRGSLRQRALTSPMFDAPRFARHFETAVWDMWRQTQSSRQMHAG